MEINAPERRIARNPVTSKTKAPEQTFEEAKYLRQLIEDRVPVRVKLTDNQEVEGTVEFFDVHFIRITRDGEPNLFLFKHDIKYLYEAPGNSSEIPHTTDAAADSPVEVR